jgi:hypothetical protein
MVFSSFQTRQIRSRRAGPTGKLPHRKLIRIFFRSAGQFACANPFPHFRTMDGNTGIDVETQSHPAPLNLKDRDFEQTLEAPGSTDHDRFTALSRQD